MQKRLSHWETAFFDLHILNPHFLHIESVFVREAMY